MNRDEFTELVYETFETFADEPDNVLANGIIEAADAYAEHEKAQLSQECTTSDLISRTETVEHLRRMLEATVPNTDYDEGFVDGVEFGVSTVSTMPTIQPQSTTGQLNDSARSTNLIDRQAAIDGKISIQRANGVEIYSDEAVPVEYLKSLPPAQPEPTDINAKEAVYNLAEKIGIHQLFALTVELRGEPIQPERKKGEWSDGYRWQRCSLCKQTGKKSWNYCPNCGADMRGKKDG